MRATCVLENVNDLQSGYEQFYYVDITVTVFATNNKIYRNEFFTFLRYQCLPWAQLSASIVWCATNPRGLERVHYAETLYGAWRANLLELNAFM